MIYSAPGFRLIFGPLAGPGNWADLREDEMTYSALGPRPIFGPLGPTAGPTAGPMAGQTSGRMR
jgi:hypothetical protein